MKTVRLTNRLNDKVEQFKCIDYDVERGYYRFLISSKNIKVVPSYDYIIDIEFEWEVDIKGDKYDAN